MRGNLAMRQTPDRYGNPQAAPARPRGIWARLLSDVLQLAGPAAELRHHTERDWNSVTFSGSRHTITLD